MENKELETQDTVMTPDVYRKNILANISFASMFLF